MGAVLLRGATGSAGAHLVGALLALMAQLVLARLLGVSQYGYYVYAFTWVMVLAHFCRLGFQNSLIRFTASYRTTGDTGALQGLLRQAPLLGTSAALLTGGVLLGVVAIISDKMPHAQFRTFVIAAALLLPMTLLGLTQGFLQGFRRPARALLPVRALTQGGTLVLALAAAATVGLAHATHAMLLTVLAATGALALAGFWVRQAAVPEILGALPVYQTRYWVRASLPLLLMGGMQILMKQTDTVMLGALTGTDAAGLYFPAARMSELAAIGLLSVNAIVAPMIAEMHTTGERERLQRLLTFAAIGTSTITLAGIVGFWLLGQWVLAFFGPAFPAAYPALMVLLIGQVVNALCGPVGYLMTMTGHQDRASLVLVGGALANLTLNALLIPRFGLIGAAAATAASTAFWNLWMLVEVVRRHRLNPSVFAPWPRVRL